MNTVGPETFLIPSHYRGKVIIIYKETCGNWLEKSKEGMVYQIPEDGILILRNKLKTGLIDHKYFLVDEKGSRTLLTKMDIRDFNEEWTLEKNQKEPPRNKLGIFHWGRTGTANAANGQNSYSFQEFYISTYNDLDKRFDFKYEQQFERKTELKLTNCK